MSNLVPAKCLYQGQWVNFNLIIGNFDNIIVFLNANNVAFLTTMELDFTSIPLVLHGRGRSRNLLEYLSNNNDNNSLISKFLNYFLSDIADIRYFSDKKINFNLSTNTKWQDTIFTVTGPYIPPITPTTTTTTTEPEPTTTAEPETFELFGKLHIL